MVPIGVAKTTDEENHDDGNAMSMPLTELLRKAEAEPDLDTLREGVRVLTQALMELKVAQQSERRALSAQPRAAGRAQRLPRSELGHAGGHARAAGAAGT